VLPLYGITIVNDFYLTCDGWIDPEDVGIKHYLIYSEINIKCVIRNMLDTPF
jgi:hypothetical protein